MGKTNILQCTPCTLHRMSKTSLELCQWCHDAPVKNWTPNLTQIQMQFIHLEIKINRAQILVNRGKQ